MKKILSAIISLCFVLSISACGKAETTDATTTAATTTAMTTAKTTAATTAAPATQAPAKAETSETSEDATADSVYPFVSIYEYNDFEMVEYIALETDFDYTPGMIEVNDAIYEDIVPRILDFEGKLEDSDYNTSYDVGGINILADSITDENFIQIYYSVLEYPAYGTAGDLFGYVYDIAADDYLTVDEFLEMQGTTAEDETFAMTENFAAANPGVTFGETALKTFVLSMGPDGEYLYGLMFEMEITYPDSDPYKGFFMFTPYDSEVWKLNSTQLFDPYTIDQYYPPLHGQEDWTDYYNEHFLNPDSTDMFGMLQGDYYFDGDKAAAHFSFYGTENVDAYYASGSYETSYRLEYLSTEEITDEDGTFNIIKYDVYNAEDGKFVFTIKLFDDEPGSFQLFDNEGNFVTDCVNVDSASG